MSYGLAKEALLERYKTQKVGYNGHVNLVDVMGDDAAHVQAARVSYGKGTKSLNDDRALIRYLIRHQHSSPIEMSTIKLHLKMPIYIARQWMRHRTASLNEVSLRYSEFADEFEMTEEWRLQSKDNKQGSAGTLDEALWASDQEASILSTITGFYHQLLDNGVAREMARKILPVSTYTEFYWQMNSRNLLHFLGLRLDKHAQQEIREFAEAIYRIVKDWIPLTAEAFEDYQLGARLLSRQELEVIREFFHYEDLPSIAAIVETKEGMSKREKKEFLALLGVG